MISIWRRSPRRCWRLCREAAEQAAVSSGPEVVAAEGQTGAQGGLGALEIELKDLLLGSVWECGDKGRPPGHRPPLSQADGGTPDGLGSTGWDV